MADPYLPPRPGGSTTAGGEQARTSIRVDTPSAKSGGMGTGLLVAGVFAIVAILAFVVFGRDGGGPDIGAAGGNVPAVSIENNAAPAAPVADPAPAAPVPAPVAPADPAPAAPAPGPAPTTAAPAPSP